MYGEAYYKREPLAVILNAHFVICSLNESQAQLDKTKTEATGTMAATEEEIILLKTE